MRKFILFFLLIFTVQVLSASEDIKVGFYENPPKIYSDKNGNPVGFWAEITSYIAEKEDWDLAWFYGDWDECLSRLENGQIDIMVDVGYTPDRAEIFAFCNETVHLSWTRIYRNPEVDIHSILDLEAKTIAGLKGSFDLEGPEGLKAVTQSFEIDCEIIEMSNYLMIFENLQAGKIDAGIVDKDFGNINDKNFAIESTPIVLQPAKMQYAFTEDNPETPEMIASIDHHLKLLKQDNNSFYYKMLEKYFSPSQHIFLIPSWTKYLLIIAFILILIFFVFNRILEHKVRDKTRELKADIDKRIETEKKLKQSEENYKAITEQAADAICKVDKSGRIIQVNPAMIKISGYSEQELLRMDLQELFSKDSRSWDPSLKSGGSKIVQRKIENKHGRTIPIEMNSKVLSDGSVLTIIRNLEKRQEIQKENHRLAEIVRNMKEGVILTDLEGKIHYVNEAFEEMSGYTTSELIGKDPAQFIIREDVSSYSKEIRTTALDEGIWQDEMLCKRKNGESYPIKSQVFTIKNDAGEKIELAAIQEDITKQKKAEQELAAYRDKLEEMVKERTQELETKNRELEKFNRLFVGREIRIKELKDKVKRLEETVEEIKSRSFNE